MGGGMEEQAGLTPSITGNEAATIADADFRRRKSPMPIGIHRRATLRRVIRRRRIILEVGPMPL
jgi:hypothetical protein